MRATVTSFSTDPLEPLGYRIVRGAFPQPEMSAIQSAFDGLVRIARGLTGTTDVGRARFVVRQDPFRLARVVWAGGADPTLAALGTDPRFVDLAAEVLGNRSLEQLIQQAHFKFPGTMSTSTGTRTPRTVATAASCGTTSTEVGSFVQIALAVDRHGRDNGPLRADPGQPSTGASSRIPHGRASRRTPRRGARAIELELAPGDLVAFGPFLHPRFARATEARRPVACSCRATPNRAPIDGCIQEPDGACPTTASS